MAVQGVFASDAHIVGNRKTDFAGSLLQIMPTGSAQLFALSSGMESRPAFDVIINWFEESHISGRTKITALTTDGDGTSFTLDDASSYVPGMIVYEEERDEYMMILTVNTTTNVVTVQRNINSGVQTTVVVNDHFQRIGTAHEEASGRPTAVANLGLVKFNYCQIFRNEWNVSGTAKAGNYQVAHPIAKNKADAAMFHSEDIERSMLWGAKFIGVNNGQPLRVADGVYELITTNITAAGATTDWNEVDTFFKDVFSKNIKGKPNERIAFTGNTGLQVLNQVAKTNAQLQISVAQTEFGMNVNKLITPYGTVSLMTHPLMVESPFFTKDLLVLHPGAIRTRPYRRTFIDNYDQNGQRAGVDADFGIYTTEISWELNCEICSGILKGLTKGVVDA